MCRKRCRPSMLSWPKLIIKHILRTCTGKSSGYGIRGTKRTQIPNCREFGQAQVRSWPARVRTNIQWPMRGGKYFWIP